MMCQIKVQLVLGGCVKKQPALRLPGRHPALVAWQSIPQPAAAEHPAVSVWHWDELWNRWSFPLFVCVSQNLFWLKITDVILNTVTIRYMWGHYLSQGSCHLIVKNRKAAPGRVNKMSMMSIYISNIKTFYTPLIKNSKRESHIDLVWSPSRVLQVSVL